MNYTYKPFFAAESDAYGTDSYGAGSYECTVGTAGCVATPGGTSLVNTGSPWFIPVMLGAALIIAAVILIVTKIVRRRKSKQA